MQHGSPIPNPHPTPQTPEGKLLDSFPYFHDRKRKSPETWRSAAAQIWNKKLYQFMDSKNFKTKQLQNNWWKL